jgi:hypothetical protein
MEIKNFSQGINFFNKGQEIFNNSNRFSDFKLKVKLQYKPFLFSQPNINLYSLPVNIQNFIFNTKTMNLLNFSYYNNEINSETVEDSYENLKIFKFLYFLNYQSTNINAVNCFCPVSYTTVLDTFRADYDENN